MMLQQCYTKDNLSFILLFFMLLQALHVEIETKNLNLQVTLLVRKGVGTCSYTKKICGNAKFPHVPTPQHPWLIVNQR